MQKRLASLSRVGVPASPLITTKTFKGLLGNFERGEVAVLYVSKVTAEKLLMPTAIKILVIVVTNSGD